MIRELRTALRGLVPRSIRPLIRKAMLKPVAFALRGNTVTCPCCGRSFRRFINYVGPNLMCPHCGSFERQRVLVLYLSREGILARPLKVLHVGPEECMQRWLQHEPAVDYSSVDLDSPLAQDRMDVTALEYADDSFDLVLCSHVLEHVVDDRQAMNELARVTKPNGLAIVQIPVDRHRLATVEDAAIDDPHARRERFGQEDHVRLYGRDVRQRLESAGLAVTVEDYAEQLGSHATTVHQLRWPGPVGGENLYLCSPNDGTGAQGQ